MSQPDTTTALPENNGEAPINRIEQSVMFLMAQSSDLRERKEALSTELREVSDQLSQFDSAIRSLTREKKSYKSKAKAKAEQVKVKAARKGSGDPKVTQAAEGYPTVSEEKQSMVYDVLVSMGEPAVPSEIVAAGNLNKSTVQNGLAHLRARGLVRWAGRGKTGGHRYAPWNEGDTEVTD
jgi:hypothetical protein